MNKDYEFMPPLTPQAYPKPTLRDKIMAAGAALALAGLLGVAAHIAANL